jgi:hypothetical protein
MNKGITPIAPTQSRPYYVGSVVPTAKYDVPLYTYKPEATGRVVNIGSVAIPNRNFYIPVAPITPFIPIQIHPETKEKPENSEDKKIVEQLEPIKCSLDKPMQEQFTQEQLIQEQHVQESVLSTLELESAVVTYYPIRNIDPKNLSMDDQYFLNMEKENKIKKCPNCGIYIEKTDGCNYIKCRCQIQFCWLCGLIKYIPNGCNDKSHNSH